MVPELVVNSDQHMVLELVSSKLNEPETAGPSTGKVIPDAMISVIILYKTGDSHLNTGRASAVRAFFQKFEVIMQATEAGERSDWYWRFGLHGSFSSHGVTSEHDNWIRVKAVDGLFSAASLWADLTAAHAAQLQLGTVTLRARDCGSPAQVRAVVGFTRHHEGSIRHVQPFILALKHSHPLMGLETDACSRALTAY